MHILAKATLDFCPPDKLAMVCNAKSPDTPKLPNCLRYSSIGLPSNKKVPNPTTYRIKKRRVPL